MGVLRMGLGSLRYGRGFPVFKEIVDSVEVSMDAEFFKPPIAVLSLDNVDNYGIPELLILNSVHQIGYVAVEELEIKLERLVGSPWNEIEKAVESLDQVEFSANNSGIVVRVFPTWKKYLEVGRLFRPSSNSKKTLRSLLVFKKAW